LCLQLSLVVGGNHNFLYAVIALYARNVHYDRIWRYRLISGRFRHCQNPLRL
jgi:hypothetical protein